MTERADGELEKIWCQVRAARGVESLFTEPGRCRFGRAQDQGVRRVAEERVTVATCGNKEYM